MFFYFFVFDSETLQTVERYRDTYKGLTKAGIGPDKLIVMAFDYDFLELILSSMKTIDKSPDYKPLHRWLSNGLLTSTGTYSFFLLKSRYYFIYII